MYLFSQFLLNFQERIDIQSVLLLLLRWDVQHSLVFVVLQSDKYPLGPPLVPVHLVPLLAHRLRFLEQEVGVGDVVAFVILQRWSLYFLNSVACLHPLPQLVKTLEVKHTFAQRLNHVTSLENVCSRSFLGDQFNVDIPVEN